MGRILIIVLVGIMCSCGNEAVPLPKPRLYPKIEFPAKDPQLVELNYCPFKFNFPDYAKAVQDSFYFEKEISDQCWFDLVFPSLNGRIHISYISLIDRPHFDDMVQDAYELVAKHNVKANYRDEKRINYRLKKVYGMQYEIDGPVASPLQFYLTDSTKHFLRGSLYFNSQVDPDSIAPVYNFVRRDVEDMIKSFTWE